MNFYQSPRTLPQHTLVTYILLGAVPLILCAVAGGGAALLGGAIGIPLLFRQAKVWNDTM
jgi:hypothetical protein